MEFALMVKAVLRGCLAFWADMSGAILDGAVLTRAELRSVNLRGAGLRDARLDEADLRDARLGGAFLVGASLRRRRFARRLSAPGKARWRGPLRCQPRWCRRPDRPSSIERTAFRE